MNDLHALGAEVSAKAVANRYLLGIAGPPGSGKSTLAARLADAVNAIADSPPAVGVGLDGFHLTNAELDRRNLRAVKGNPQTFDVGGLIALLKRLRSDDAVVMAPRYCRELHEPVAGAIRIDASVKLIIVEGNYLLLDAEPWRGVRALLDEVWYLDVPQDICMARVHARHIAGGCTPQQAAEKIAMNDRPNHQMIAATRHGADRIVRSDA